MAATHKDEGMVAVRYQVCGAFANPGRINSGRQREVGSLRKCVIEFRARTDGSDLSRKFEEESARSTCPKRQTVVGHGSCE